MKTTNDLEGHISAEKAIRLAEQWWDKTGRHLMSKKFNEAEQGRKFLPSTDNAPALVMQGEKIGVIASGILKAYPWDMLTRREKLHVTKTWHQYIYLPGIGQQSDATLEQRQRLGIH